ncbi:MAG: hypothetical protein WCI77_10030 [Candidatus Omnitrophota bacterium]
MKIEFSLFITILTASIISVAFVLEYIQRYRRVKLQKNIDLKRQQCEVCASIYFIPSAAKFWRCPLCASINK